MHGYVSCMPSCYNWVVYICQVIVVKRYNWISCDMGGEKIESACYTIVLVKWVETEGGLIVWNRLGIFSRILVKGMTCVIWNDIKVKTYLHKIL